MDALEAFALAGQSLRTVIISYTDAKGAGSTREVEPYSLRPGKGGAIRAFAYDLTRDNIRGFRADRIASAQVTENPYVPRWVVEF